MKKIIVGVIFLVLTFSLFGCSNSDQKKEDETKSLVGYIFIEKDTIYFDEVEIITREDTNRIKELGLVEKNDYPSGYCIYNPVSDIVTFKLTSDTIYKFSDFNQFFIEKSEGDRVYQTIKKDEFLKGSSYQDIPLEKQKIPYFLEIKDGKVISIFEDFIYTQ